MSDAVMVAVISAVPTTIAAVGAVWSSFKLRHELKPNSGASLRDAVDRIESHAGTTAARLERFQVEQDVHNVRTDMRLDRLEGGRSDR